MATTSEQIKKFYEVFNSIIAPMPLGVRWQVSEQLQMDVAIALKRYRHELANEMWDQAEENADLRQKYKKSQALRANRGPAELTAPTYSTSADGGKVA